MPLTPRLSRLKHLAQNRKPKSWPGGCMTTRDGSISALKDKAGSASRALSRATSVGSRFLKWRSAAFYFHCFFLRIFIVAFLLHITSLFLWILHFPHVGLEEAQSDFYTLLLYTSHPPIETQKGFRVRIFDYAYRCIFFLLRYCLFKLAANTIEKEMLNVYTSIYILCRTAMPCPKPSPV